MSFPQCWTLGSKSKIFHHRSSDSSKAAPEFILFQSASAEASSELADPPSSKRCRSDHVSDEQSTL